MTDDPANIDLTFDEHGVHTSGTDVIELGSATALTPF